MSLRTVKIAIRMIVAIVLIAALTPLVQMLSAIPSDRWCGAHSHTVACVNVPLMKQALRRDELDFAVVLAICALLLGFSETAKPRGQRSL